MKNLALGILWFGLATSAAAIDRGECCASVGNVCISTCQKSSCTGNGDCDLALTSRPAGISSTTPAIRSSYKTMSRRDQHALRKIMNKPTPVRAGGRPDEDPPEGGLFNSEPQGGFKAPTASIPVLTQTGGTTAKVPMKHGSCGLDCGTHKLAVQGGNLDIPFKISMSCPAGAKVSFLAYKMKGQNQVKVVNSATGSSSFSKNVKLQPFSKDELEEACRVALGGDWPQPGSHKNKTKTVTKNLAESVKVWGKCTGWANQTLRTYPAKLRLTCEDQSWYVPVP